MSVRACEHELERSSAKLVAEKQGRIQPLRHCRIIPIVPASERRFQQTGPYHIRHQAYAGLRQQASG